jgi:serine/threonine protein kinase
MHVALKLIINTEQMHDQGKIETSILQKLNEAGQFEKSYIVKALDFFTFRRHICVTFEILGANLYEVVNAIKEAPLVIPARTDPLVCQLLHGMINVNPVERFTIEDVLNYPLIRNAEERVQGLPDAVPPPMSEGELQVLTADVCPEGTSFAEIAVAIKRRSSVQEYGFITSRQSGDEIPRAPPRGKLVYRASEGDLERKPWNSASV